MFLIVFGVILVITLYLYGVKDHDYWKKRRVTYVKPIPYFGSFFHVFTQRICFSDQLYEYYFKYTKDKFLGIFVGNRIGLMLRDPELIKHVLATDFYHFHPRGFNPHKTVIEPLTRNLFTGDGDTWKLLRQRTTPAFTSGKLKAMFPLIVERAEKLQTIAAVAEKSNTEVDIRELMARYTTDFIGACGFGLDADTLNDENSTFRQLGKRIFTITKREALMIMLKTIAPETFKNLHIMAPEVEEKIFGLVTGIMKQRNYKTSGRNDFIDLLLELKNKGTIVGESIEMKNDDGTPKIVELEIDDWLMTAQVFIFFAAGFETSSSTTSYTLHLLAFHPEEQKKCQEEIDEVLNRHGGKLSYDAVKEMKYLDMVFRESMRMFPSLGFLSRRCAMKYTIPETNVTIDEGVSIYIPVHALQNDEKYFPEPEKFKPERFSAENTRNIQKYVYLPFGEGPRACIAGIPILHERHDEKYFPEPEKFKPEGFSAENARNIQKYVYLPFGEGPRACIGERLGLMQSLAGLAALLSKFSVAPSKSTLRHPITNPCSVVVNSVKDGLPLSLVARN